MASWNRRLGALLVDWGASMVMATAIFGPQVVRGAGWQVWMPMLVFFLESTVLTALTGASFGQLVARLVVVRLDTSTPVGWWRAAARTAMKCLVVPAVVVGAGRRGLDDLALGTVVVSRV